MFLVNTLDNWSQNLTTNILKNRIQRIIRMRFYAYLIENVLFVTIQRLPYSHCPCLKQSSDSSVW